MKPLHDRKQSAHNSESGLTAACVEVLFANRKAMLRSLRGDVNIALHDTLSKKIEYEYAYLLQGVADRAQALETEKSLRAVLRPEYFIQKKLDLNTL